MDGIHDMGGRQGFGPVVREQDEPAFHEPWEASVYAMAAVMERAGLGNHTVDRFRHAIERIDPAAYLTHTYYGRWLGGLETLFEEAGILTGDLIDQRMRELAGLAVGEPISRAARPQAVSGTAAVALSGLDGHKRQASAAARFQVGERVRTSAHGSSGHTRLPGYARNKLGEIAAAHGAWVFPDTNAQGRGEQPCHLYTVVFQGSELWGEDCEGATEVCIDLFEPYLHRVEK